jgi:hypothetical protein
LWPDSSWQVALLLHWPPHVVGDAAEHWQSQ